jgi:hypothetical protein
LYPLPGQIATRSGGSKRATFPDTLYRRHWEQRKSFDRSARIFRMKSNNHNVHRINTNHLRIRGKKIFFKKNSKIRKKMSPFFSGCGSMVQSRIGTGTFWFPHQ